MSVRHQLLSSSISKGHISNSPRDSLKAPFSTWLKVGGCPSPPCQVWWMHSALTALSNKLLKLSPCNTANWTLYTFDMDDELTFPKLVLATPSHL